MKIDKETENKPNLQHESNNLKKEVSKILEELIENNTISVSSIPNIDLYIDQVTTFIENSLFTNQSNHLTKSMVNNYCKNKIISPAVKKKYTKSHIMLLIMIYNTKSILSITDIGTIFNNIHQENVEQYYKETVNLILNHNQNFINDTLNDLDKIIAESTKKSQKYQIAILATKLAIEANYKKILSEILIENYLK